MQFLDHARQQTDYLANDAAPASRLTPTAVGVINLAAHARDAERLTPDQWSFFLQGFNQFYDAVIDMEAFHSLRMSTIDLSDARSMDLSAQRPFPSRHAGKNLDALHNQKFSFAKFIFALNQAGTPQSLSEDMFSQGLERFWRKTWISRCLLSRNFPGS